MRARESAWADRVALDWLMRDQQAPKRLPVYVWLALIVPSPGILISTEDRPL